MEKEPGNEVGDDFQGAFSQQLFNAIHEAFILRDVLLTKISSVSFITLT